MQKNNLLLITGLLVLLGVAVFFYRKNTTPLSLAGKAIAAIDLRYFAQRAAVVPAATFEAKLRQADADFEQNPVNAMGKYQDLLKQDPGFLDLRMRMGMLQLKLRQYEAAREHLRLVYEQKEASLQPDACWFLALLAIVEEDEVKARDLLTESFVAGGSQYQKQAKELYQQLQ